MRTDLEPVAVPYLGRIILGPAVLAHGFAMTGLVGGWSAYRVPWAAAALLSVSMALPVVLVVVPRWCGGRLPTRAAAVVVAGVFAVSLAVPALLPPDARSSMQAWNWGTGAMTLLGVALYLSTARVVVLAFGHAAVGVAVQLLAGGGAWRCHIVLISSLVPPLGAVQYLRFPVPSEAAALLANPAQRTRVVVDHPRYKAEQEMPAALRTELLADLRA